MPARAFGVALTPRPGCGAHAHHNLLARGVLSTIQPLPPACAASTAVLHIPDESALLSPLPSDSVFQARPPRLAHYLSPRLLPSRLGTTMMCGGEGRS
ncbi:hypothetical protein B0H10DRAFT_2084228 [Mycena sp. CBHHK59/15]|nr:hypothetical protein B0H10DRAFT_2084228 [Mycena sp. CBHHK59/15]